MLPDAAISRPRHLIHVGFPKTASTSLQAWFAAHPDIAFWPFGLVGYNGVVAMAHDVAADRRPAWYVTSYEGLVMPRLLDDHPDELTHRPTAERRRRMCALLRELFGDATILIVTRGHATVLASAYSQYLREGGSLSLARMTSFDFSASYIEDGWDYDAAIDDYEHLFGAENVIVLPYELLIDDPAAFAGTLEERLRVSHLDADMPWMHTSLTSAEIRWYPRLSHAAAYLSSQLGSPGRRLAAAYHRRIGHSSMRQVASLLSRLRPEPTIDPPTSFPPECSHVVAAVQSTLHAAKDMCATGLPTPAPTPHPPSEDHVGHAGSRTTSLVAVKAAPSSDAPLGELAR